MIPDPDPLGLPGPAALLKILLVTTFVLHLIPMNIVMGGGIVAVWASWRARRGGEKYGALASDLAQLLPVSTAAAITLGVAPLLFLQALYGRFFFTSSILMAWGWLAVIALLLLGYYGYYTLSGRRSLGLAIGCSAVFLVVGLLFTHNMTLMLRPESWRAMYGASDAGVHANWGDPTLWPRYLHFVIASVAVTGLAVALQGRYRSDEWRRRWGSRLFAWATLVQMGGGIWFLLALPDRARSMLLGGSALDTAVLALSILAAVGSIAMALRDERLGAAGILATIAGMAVVRHRVREALLEPISVESSAGAPWGAVILFAALVAVGAALIVWMLRRLAVRNQPAR